MNTTTIRISRAKVATKFDLNYIGEAIDQLEMEILDHSGCHVRIHANSQEFTIETATNNLVDTATTLQTFGLI
jgi:hypothetical protein